MELNKLTFELITDGGLFLKVWDNTGSHTFPVSDFNDSNSATFEFFKALWSLGCDVEVVRSFLHTAYLVTLSY